MSLFRKSGHLFHVISAGMLILLNACSHVKTDHYPNGSIRSEITIQGGHFNGPARFYFESGALMTECHYVNDSLEGQLIRYHENGSRQEVKYYKMNRPDSTCRSWNGQGQLLVDAFYHLGLLEGNYREYYDNGQLKTSGRYRNGEPVGLWLYYDQNGYVIGKENH